MAEGTNTRSRKVGQEIQSELGRLLIDGVHDPRVGFVTVTEVRMSPDLRVARVFVSAYGAEHEREQALKGLDSAKGFLRRELGRKMSLRVVPELVFCLDTTLDSADRMQDLLHAIADGETQAPSNTAPVFAPVITDRSDREAPRQKFAVAKSPKRSRPKGKRGNRR